MGQEWKGGNGSRDIRREYTYKIYTIKYKEGKRKG